MADSEPVPPEREDSDPRDSDRTRQWCDDMRCHVAGYLDAERVRHGQVGDRPVFQVAPYVSVWEVESAARPGNVGGWVVCGDLPTDCVCAEEVAHPRAALAAIAERWRRYAEAVRRGEPPEGFEIAGVADDPDNLLPQLESRAETLAQWAEDDGAWSDEASDQQS